MRACTLVRANEVAAARVLAGSLARVQPDLRLIALATHGAASQLQQSEPFDTMSTGDFGPLGLGETLASAEPRAQAALLRAMLVRQVLTDGDDPVLLLPCDAELHASLDALYEALSAAPVVLVPRLLGCLPDDGERPDGTDLIQAGEIDDELVAVAASDEGRAFADWWVARGQDAIAASRDSQVTPVSSLAAARRVFEHVSVLGDAGFDVSYWNLHERSLERRDEMLLAGGRPLVLMRFAGFRPDRPWWLSDRGSRVLVLDDPILGELCGAHARALEAAGWSATGERADDLNELAPGIVFDERIRMLHAEAVDAGERFGDLSSSAAVDGLLAWLREPAPHGGAAGVNRYAHDVWRRRSDLREAYPNLDGGDAEGFSGWLWVHGRGEMGLQEALLPPPPDWLDSASAEPPAVLVAGYLRGNLGLGQAARGYVRALEAAGVPVVTRTFATDPPPAPGQRAVRSRPETRPFEDRMLPGGVDPAVSLLCVNADQLPQLAAELDDEPAGRYTIGQWAWETDAIPDRWDQAFSLVDEIWVYSSYVAENVGRASPVPVVVVPLPVEVPSTPACPAPVDLADGDFVFLFAFDYFSTLERKNPHGLIEAFTRAFAPGEGPKLIVKTIHADFRPEARDRLRWTAGGREDVMLLDAALPPDGMAALFARADCYVSLHRSEGFGLTPAEAMALGKPVIATAYGGNTDFMTPANSYLVEWEPIDVGPDAEHYPAEGTWADPSIEHAAALMREVWADREGARRRGAHAAHDIAAVLSPKAVGAVASRRLERIARTLRGRTGTQPASSLDVLEGPLGFDLVGAGGAGGVRGAARRAVLRAIRPYTTAERRLDEAVAARLRGLQIELEAERAARTRDRHRIARLERRLAELDARDDR
jgi:glycosyltransferase involved in cell wall biosynthesis